jgi:hypothetical protein
MGHVGAMFWTLRWRHVLEIDGPVRMPRMTNSNTDATIRRATPDDAPALAVLGAATFTETFGHLYPPEDLRTFLVESHSVDAWIRTLGFARSQMPSAPLGWQCSAIQRRSVSW